MTPIVRNTGPILKLEEVLEEAKKTKDWFEAIVYSAIQLERYGYLEMKDYLESLDVSPKLVSKILETKRLSEIAKYLLTIERINNEEYTFMIRINEERNKFIHRKKGYDFLIGTRANQEYEPLVKEAIRILKEKLNAIRLYVSRC